MSARLTSKFIVTALLKHTATAGGYATVLSHGDDNAGAVIIVCAEKGQVSAILELAYDPDNRFILRPCIQQPSDNKQQYESYLSKRRQSDPDLWIIELDVPSPERFTAECLSIA